MKKILLLTIFSIFLINPAYAAFYDLGNDISASLKDIPSDFYELHGNFYMETSRQTIAILGDLDVMETKVWNLIKSKLPAQVIEVRDYDISNLQYRDKSIFNYNIIVVGGSRNNMITDHLDKNGLLLVNRSISNKPRVIAQGFENQGAYIAVISSPYSYPEAEGVKNIQNSATAAAVSVASVGGLAWLLNLLSRGDTFISKLFKYLGGAAFEAGQEKAEEKLFRKTHKKKLKMSGKIVVIISIFIMGAAYTYSLFPQSFLEWLPFCMTVSAIGIVGRDVVRHLVAKKLKIKSELVLWPLGIILVVITSALGNLFANSNKIVYDSKDKRSMGLTAFAGPLFNFASAIAILLLGHILSPLQVSTAVGLNLLLAFYQMIPIDPLDGDDVYRWKKSIWLISFLLFSAFYIWFVILA